MQKRAFTWQRFLISCMVYKNMFTYFLMMRGSNHLRAYIQGFTFIDYARRRVNSKYNVGIANRRTRRIILSSQPLWEEWQSGILLDKSVSNLGNVTYHIFIKCLLSAFFVCRILLYVTCVIWENAWWIFAYGPYHTNIHWWNNVCAMLFSVCVYICERE